MRRRPPAPPPTPEGHVYARTKMVTLELMESSCRIRMDRPGNLTWREDPSYHWAAKVKAKRKRRLGPGRSPDHGT